MERGLNTYLAIWLIVLPILGIPILWKNLLVLATGLVMLLVQVWPAIRKFLRKSPELPGSYTSQSEEE